MDLKALRLKIDPTKGGWVDLGYLGEEFAGGKVHVRPLWNADFAWLYAKLAADVPADRKLPNGNLHPADEARIQAECLKQTVLIGWEGFTDGGEPMVYSDEKKAELLDDPLGLPFRGAVMRAAMDVQTKGRDSLEADLKN